MTTETKQTLTTQQVADRFNALAQKEMWFEIQDELFADNVRSVEPADSPYFKDAQGKSAVRKKGEDWVARVQEVHKLSTTTPIVGGNHFAVGREVDITVEGHGKVVINQIMLYEVKDGRIVLEQFTY
ncbi:nuclear transport factor 2 family protein [Chryseolinea lacunae]|uniref:Nuclear transport factor 2 family protein n=1 Tax=Chryseolinea lacunae TaxID=2801331 RepID=A0ABS1L0V8_9BACT|nr:nuclear transport factor 2 family protein [Chryseolinea lacunae]MBL0745220.1 nuclear transport factor 2 family protein [Chryseolinea lacunae]